MFNNIVKYIKFIFLFLFLINNFLFSNCRVIIAENFFNDDIIGYYLSAINVDTGESNLLLFDYQIDFIDCEELPENLYVDFNIQIDVPDYTSGQVSIIEGTFKLTNLTSSVSFRNTDLNSGTSTLPSGVQFLMNASDYHVGITGDEIEELSALILSLGRLPNGRYSFEFEVKNYNCPQFIDCDSAKLIKEVNIFLPEYLSLLTPGSSDLSNEIYNQIHTLYPVFQWNADYCSKCSNYSIRISEYHSDIHASLEDAINSYSILPSGSGFFDIGSQNNLFQYPVTGFEDLQRGNAYVWQVRRTFQTTYGIEEELSDIFIFNIKNNDSGINNDIELNEQNLNLIIQLVGQSKFDELFILESGLLYNYIPSSVIKLDGNEKTISYLLELIELLNNSKIEILEIDVE
tara:strand:- start:14086 stop:15291 length:1206 start_codon:yes stop_codon:yes gene_type:complete